MTLRLGVTGRHFPHGITVLPATLRSVNTLRLTPAMQAGTYSIYLPRRDGRLS